MHRALIAILAACLYAMPALANPIVVWLEQDLPEDKYLRKAENSVGPSIHLSHVDLAFPPQPHTEADEKRMGALRTEVIEARAVWDDFDVELGIATDLQGVLDEVTLVRDSRDLEEVVDAYLVQGAAISRAFSPVGFREDAAAAPFRAEVPGDRVNRGWLQAIALAPDRTFAKSDLVDGGPWPQFEELYERLKELPPGFLDVSSLPRGATVVVDGRVIDRGIREVQVPPGEHFVHLIRNDVVSGRMRVSVEAGLTTDVALPVDVAALGQANSTLVAGSTVGMPEQVESALNAIGAHYRGDVYLAALDGNNMVLEPWTGEAERPKRRVVTVLATGEIGGGVVVSPLFDGSGGDPVTSPAAHGGLGLEIGIFNAVLLGGFDVALTPGQTVTHGNAEEDDNVTTSVLPQAWGGIGAYLSRPSDPRHTTLLLAGTYSWLGPAHFGLGGRVTLGIPMDDRGTWFRLTVGGSSAGKSSWDEGNEETPMHVLFLRLGFGTRF